MIPTPNPHSNAHHPLTLDTGRVAWAAASGAVLSARMRELGMSLLMLANRSRVTRSTLENLVNGREQPTLQQCSKLALPLGWDLGELVQMIEAEVFAAKGDV